MKLVRTALEKLGCAASYVILPLLFIASTSVEARQFYTLKTKAILTYSHLNSSTKKMGSAKGTLEFSDDMDLAVLVLDGNEYPANVTKFYPYSDGRLHLYTFQIKKETLEEIAKLANNSWFQNRSTKVHVGDLLERYLNDQPVQKIFDIVVGKDCGYSYCRNGSFRIQLHDDQSPESVHLTFEFDDKPEIR